MGHLMAALGLGGENDALLERLDHAYEVSGENDARVGVLRRRLELGECARPAELHATLARLCVGLGDGTGAAASFLRGSGEKVMTVPWPASPVIAHYSSATSASPDISTVSMPCSRIWRAIRPASVW